MRLAPRPFFALSSLIFIAAAGFCAWKLLPVENGGVMSCSTKAIMRFENMEKENVNGNIHFNFAKLKNIHSFANAFVNDKYNFYNFTYL